MFQSARLKLTAWYLLIIMLICVAFSAAIYESLTSELDRVERIQRSRQERVRIPSDDFPLEFKQGPTRSMLDPQLVAETKRRLLLTLVMIDLGILGVSSLAGFFLAGRTLNPIKEMMDEQNRFITDSSHELRTPITSLKTATEVYLRSKEHSIKEADDLLKSNLDEINSLQLLSDGLIKLTQHQKSNGAIFEETDLLSLTNEALKKVSKLAKHKNINIENLITDCKFESNRQSMLEVFVILLDNAIKYSQKNKQIKLLSECNDDRVVIKIKDQGIGIAQKDLGLLFDRFYRADKSRTKSSSQGYGLGLSIAKQIIDKHNGSIKVESKLSKGTTFILSLPLAQSNKIS